MARYVDAADLPVSIEEAFDYLADFSRTAEWDPGVMEASKLSEGPIGLGTRFRVAVGFLGQELQLEYEIEEYERPHRLVLRGGNDSVFSHDVISLESTTSGSRLT